MSRSWAPAFHVQEAEGLPHLPVGDLLVLGVGPGLVGPAADGRVVVGPAPSGASGAGRFGSQRRRSRTSAWAASASVPSRVTSSPSSRLSSARRPARPVVTGPAGLGHLTGKVLHLGPEIVAPADGVAGPAVGVQGEVDVGRVDPPATEGSLTAAGSSWTRRISIMVPGTK